MKLFEELKRRNVFRVGIAYLVGAWVLLQIIDFVLDAISAPNWILQVFILAAAVGLPVVLIIAWVFELTPEGIRRESQIDRSRSITPNTGRKLDRVIISFLVLAVALLLADRFIGVNGPGAETVGGRSAADSRAERAPTAAKSEVAPVGGHSAADMVANARTVNENSIAVLPFVNMSSDPEQEYFSDGITEEILNRLAGVRGLQVAARTSAFSFKGHNQDVREIAALLGVGNILEGSVRKAGDQVRITAQLIRANDGFHLWSESYDRKLENIFAIQDDIATQIAGALEISLGVSDQQAAQPAKSVNPEVYDLYLRARALHRQRGVGLLKAIELFEQALAIDPNFAPAWAGLSHVYIVLPNYVSTDDWHRLGDVLAKSMAAAEQALALDPNLPTALHAMGNNLLLRFEWAKAEDYYLRALEQDPDSADIMEDYSGLLLWSWRLEADERVVERMITLDPGVVVFLAQKASLEHAQGKFEQRDQTIHEMLGINPDLGYIQFWNLFRLLQYGKYDAAREYADQMNAAVLDSNNMLKLIDWMADVNQVPDMTVIEAFVDNACVALLVGRYDVCIDAVQQAGAKFPQWGLESAALNLLSPVVAPELMHQFRADPRIKAFLFEVRLPEYWRKVGWPKYCQPIGEDDFACF